MIRRRNVVVLIPKEGNPWQPFSDSLEKFSDDIAVSPKFGSIVYWGAVQTKMILLNIGTEDPYVRGLT